MGVQFQEEKQGFYDKHLEYTDLHFVDPRNKYVGKQFITLKDEIIDDNNNNNNN